MTQKEMSREWRQFHLLSRDAGRRLLDRALFSRDSDPVPFMLWAGALLATPPTLFALNRFRAYAALQAASDDAVARVAIGDRLFFLTYGMLVLALLGTLTWDALLSEPGEQETIGTLPVRPRTMAAARVWAGGAVAALVAGAITAPAGLVYALISTVHPAVGSTVGVLIGHIVSIVLGSVFVFFTLLSVRGILAVCGGGRIADGLGRILQLVTMVLLVNVLFFLPAVLSWLTRQALDDGRWQALPPLWFAALYAQITGNAHAALLLPSQLALLGVAASLLTAGLVCVLPARWLGRRALEVRDRDHVGLLLPAATRIGRLLLRGAVTRAIFGFAAASLMRSRRHTVMLATYLGLAVATAIVSVLVAGARRPRSAGMAPSRIEWGVALPPLTEPAAYLLALPMIFIFFAVIGLVAAARVPTDIDANWPFRLFPPTVRSTANATAAFLLTFGVLPIIVATAVAALVYWPPLTVVRVGLLQLASGMLLIECALHGWTRPPFASAHAASAETLKWRWPVFLITLNLFAFTTSGLQMKALESAMGTGAYLLFAVCGVLAVRWRRRRTVERAALEFDVSPDDSVASLNLSGALR